MGASREREKEGGVEELEREADRGGNWKKKERERMVASRQREREREREREIGGAFPLSRKRNSGKVVGEK